jgi:hypothetical protein
MLPVAWHDSGHVLMHLLQNDRRIIGFVISCMREETAKNLACLFEGVPVLQGSQPLFGLICTMDPPDNISSRDSDIDVLGSLAGFAAEHGDSFSERKFRRSPRELSDFQPMIQRLDAKLPPEKSPCDDDDVILGCARGIVGEMHDVFQSHFTCRRGMDAMARYMVLHGVSIGGRTHSDLLKVVESEGLDATKRQELLHDLESIDVDAYLW